MQCNQLNTSVFYFLYVLRIRHEMEFISVSRYRSEVYLFTTSIFFVLQLDTLPMVLLQKQAIDAIVVNFVLSRNVRQIW